MKQYRKYNNFPIIMKLSGVFLLFMGGLLLLLYLSGEWLPNYDLQIKRLGICKHASSSEIETSIPISTKPLYICGQSSGTTWMKINFYVFHNDSVVLFFDQKIEPGNFFLEIPRRNGNLNLLAEGKYRIEARSGRLIVAQSEFEVK